MQKPAKIPADKPYAWPLCPKKFRSKQAFGGHERGHLPKLKSLTNQNMQLQFSKSKLQITEQKNCQVCNKTYISDKALYGHMRKHAERNRRGIRPPHSNSEESSSTKQGLVLPDWSKRGKKRTSSRKARSLPPALPFDKLSVANCGANDPEEPPEEYLQPKKIILDIVVFSSNAENMRGAHLNGNLVNQGDVNYSPGTEIAVRGAGPLAPNESRKKYVCGICDRTFNSYQALGGHRAHHAIKRRKHRIAAGAIVRYAKPRRPSLPVVHQCPFCNKVFAKGQALGGHKPHCRRKADRNNDERGLKARGCQIVVFNFDLHELPPPESNIDDEMEGGAMLN